MGIDLLRLSERIQQVSCRSNRPPLPPSPRPLEPFVSGSLPPRTTYPISNIARGPGWRSQAPWSGARLDIGLCCAIRPANQRGAQAGEAMAGRVALLSAQGAPGQQRPSGTPSAHHLRAAALRPRVDVRDAPFANSANAPR